MTITDVQEDASGAGYYVTIDGKECRLTGGDVAAADYATCDHCGRKEEYEDDGDEWSDCITKLYQDDDHTLCHHCIEAARKAARTV